MDFPITPKNAKKFLIKTLQSGQISFLQGSPGVGKSDIMRDIAKEFNLELIDIRLSQVDQSDLLGLPFRDGNKSSYKPFDTFPLSTDVIPEGKNGWLIFFDEMNAASKAVQVACYKILLDREVGKYKLHDNVFMAAAGNKSTDRAVVNSLSTATQSRIVHYTLDVDHESWMNWAMSKGKIDHRILGYLSFAPHHLHNFKPDHQEHTFACPRTWEMLSTQIDDLETLNGWEPLVTGTIGGGVGVEFTQFCDHYKKIPSIEVIVKDPKEAPIPEEQSTKYAVTTHLIKHSTVENLPQLIEYVDRFPVEFNLLFLKACFEHRPEFHQVKALTNKARELTRYLNG